ncbi:hypothetical protein A2U01_0068476, partial [Trifolium medium]|nr:hypothetical protein [Trifolium medium]
MELVMLVVVSSSMELSHLQLASLKLFSLQLALIPTSGTESV